MLGSAATPCSSRALLPTLCLVVVAATLVPATAAAQIGDLLSVQGRLLTTAGGKAPDGQYAVTFRFYAAADDPIANALTAYVHPTVTVSDGIFAETLGGSVPLDTASIASGQAAWLGVQVGADPELQRVPLHQVPYAFRATSAAALECSGCVDAGHLAPGLLSGYVQTSALADYVKKDALADYAKTSALAEYAKTTALAEYAKTTALSDYTKTSALAPVATAGTYASLTGAPPASPADSMTAAGVQNIQGGKLYDGSTPWTSAAGTLTTEVKTSANSTGTGQTHNCSAGYKLVGCTYGYESETIQFWPGTCKIKSPTQCYGRGYYSSTYTYVVTAICARVL